MAAGLTPANGATGQSKTAQIRMEFCSMTGLELNYFRLLNPNGQIYTDVTVDSGEYWATLTPNIPLVDGVTYTVQADGRINDGGTVKAIAPGTWGFTIATPVTDYLYQQDFNGTGYSIPHTLTQNQCQVLFNSTYCRNASEGSIHLAEDPSGGGRTPVLKVDLKEGEYGLNNGNGMQSEVHWVPRSDSSWPDNQEEIYFSFDIYFPDSFIYNFSTKIMKVQTTPRETDESYEGNYARLGVDWMGNNSFTQDVIGSTYAQFDGQIASYEYWAQRTSFQKRLSAGFQKGVWQTVECHGLMNTPRSASNGISHYYLNGQLIETHSNVQWVDRADKAWSYCMLSIYSGGGSDQWRQPQNQSVYLDNLIISTNPITH